MFLWTLKELAIIKNRYQVETISNREDSGDSWNEVLTRFIILLKLKSRSCKSGFSI